MPDHPVLRRLYPSVCTLRQYLLAQTAGSSKSRRRRLAQVGVPTRLHASPTQQIDEEVGRLLDTALVATLDPAVPSLETSQQRARARDQDVAVFSQQRSPATTATTAATLESGYLLQSEVGSIATPPNAAPMHSVIRDASTVGRLLTVPRLWISSSGVSSSDRPPINLPTCYAMASSGVPIGQTAHPAIP